MIPCGVSSFHRAQNAIKAGLDGVEVQGANGQRIDPFLHNSDSGTIDDDPLDPINLVAKQLNAFSQTYLHVMRADYKREWIGKTGDTLAEADAASAEGVLDAVAFGTAFLANSGLPERIQAGAESFNGYPTMRAVTPA